MFTLGRSTVRSRLSGTEAAASCDADDENAPAEVGLHGIIHYLCRNRFARNRGCVNADLGSAPEAAVEDLLFRFVDAGASCISVS
ncbi:hypothetical protein WL32_10110 [Burkholderia cepacia]|nr:hypothetical protein WL32_10110 [Burkholderia cepacia]